MRKEEFKYIIITWPESQEFIGKEHCYLINDEEGYKLYGSSAYFVREDVFGEVMNKYSEKVIEKYSTLQEESIKPDDKPDIESYKELPDGYVKMPDLWQLFELKDKSLGRTKENLYVRSITLIVYNPQTNEYYPRHIGEHSNKQNLYKYFQDGNLYIKGNDILLI